MRASWAHMMKPPRALRLTLVERRRRLWRLKAALARTLPVPVSLNRFLALDFVFNLDISSSLQSEFGPRLINRGTLASAAGHVLAGPLFLWSSAL